MISKTKFPITDSQIVSLFQKAGFRDVRNIAPLGDGEFNAVYAATADGNEYAVKIAPSPDCDVLTYEKNMMRAELFWYDQLREKTQVHVPAVLYRDFSRETIGTDWFIMEKIDGTALNRCRLPQEEKEAGDRAIAEAAAAMHAIPGEAFGFPSGKKYDTWDRALEGILSDLVSDCEKKGKRCRNGERLLNALNKHRDIFREVPCTMVSFDLHPGNVIYAPQNTNGRFWFIDWERGIWGDRVLDFVNFDPMHPMEKKTKTLSFYNSVAAEKLTVDDGVKLRYAMGQGLLGLVMETEKYYRYTPMRFGWWRNVSACLYFYKSAFGVLEA